MRIFVNEIGRDTVIVSAKRERGSIGRRVDHSDGAIWESLVTQNEPARDFS
jgi:hypothetical protein